MRKFTDRLHKVKINFSEGLVTFLTVLALIVVFLLIYQAVIPVSYNLQVGSIADEDIVLNRAVIDRVKTKAKAERQASQIADIYNRSEEIAQKNLADLATLFKRVDAERKKISDKFITKSDSSDADWLPTNAEITAAVGDAKKILPDYLAETLSDADWQLFFTMNPSTYEMVKSNAERLADYLVKKEITSYNLLSLVQNELDTLKVNSKSFASEYSLVGDLLRAIIKPNMVFNHETTLAARKDAYDAAIAQPVMIEKGTRVVLKGDKISSIEYQILRDAGLINAGSWDWQILLGTLLDVLAVFFIGRAYLAGHLVDGLTDAKRIVSILVTFLLPIIIAAYGAEFSPFMAPVYFATIIFTTYYGMRLALVFSACLLMLVFPIADMNFQFLFCSLVGVIVCAMLTDNFTKRNRYALVILMAAIAPTFTSIALDLLMKTSSGVMLSNSLIFFAVGALSAVAAIGVMPLYEIVLDAVSPLRLVELSNPNQPLLKRLLIEAPGTAQHSAMVANLAEVAAESIGANALLSRVGALYHDIGKLNNPSYFTENQFGENPHDKLSPEESAKIIFAHVTDGVKLAEENRLPEAVTAFIVEHHGDTVLMSIYPKACKIAEEKGMPLPDPADFSYPGRIPQSKETGIVMIADSVEAAMKSTGYRDLVNTEKLIRKIVKGKNDQDQLVDSGLSYQEVEKMVQAFLRVYEGQFHERLKYPDANPVSKRKM